MERGVFVKRSGDFGNGLKKWRLLGCGGDGKSRHKAREEAIRKNINSMIAIGVPKDVSETSVRIDPQNRLP